MHGPSCGQDGITISMCCTVQKTQMGRYIPVSVRSNVTSLWTVCQSLMYVYMFLMNYKKQGARVWRFFLCECESFSLCNGSSFAVDVANWLPGDAVGLYKVQQRMRWCPCPLSCSVQSFCVTIISHLWNTKYVSCQSECAPACLSDVWESVCLQWGTADAEIKNPAWWERRAIKGSLVLSLE